MTTPVGVPAAGLDCQDGCDECHWLTTHGGVDSSWSRSLSWQLETVTVSVPGMYWVIDIVRRDAATDIDRIDARGTC